MNKPHLLLGHALWKRLLQPSDFAIDATCGNGHDTLFLAQLLHSGVVYAIDVQKEAIEKTRLRVPPLSYPQVHLFLRSHEKLADLAKAGSVKLIVYNLGYLPGSNKSLTTRASTTLMSIEEALPLLTTRGALSITCYPGHPEGLVEQTMVKERCLKLIPSDWKVLHMTWRGHPLAPSLLWICKKSQHPFHNNNA